jgi:arginyl-tRNA synthetase
MSLAIRTSLASAVQAAFTALGLAAPASVNLERPARREHGDWSTNAAMAAAKAAGRNPRDLAAALKGALDASPPKHVTAVEIAGPGFLNFRLADSWLHEVVDLVLDQGVDNYSRLAVPGARSVVVEYVSANPTGPLHAGHARWAAYGDALSRVLARSGYEMHREFYINDRGAQMLKFGQSLAARKRGTPVPEGGYQGHYIIDWAAEMPADADPVEWGRLKALDYQRSTLRRMNVEYDSWTSETAIAASGAVEATLAKLRANGHIYEAAKAENEDSERPEGDIDPDVPTAADAGNATWLRTTTFGDDRDRVVIKADGTYTYFMPDIAYHRDKFNRGDLLIDIFGADHHGYVGRMKAAIEALGHSKDDLEILIGQNCVLLRDGEPVRLSKRTGDIIELAEIIDEVGADAAKLTFLLQSINTLQTVDLGALVSESMDNPVHYVHYAHARVHGIGRQAEERGIVRAARTESNLMLLTHARELELARILGDLPDALTLACNDRAPHKITTWVRELAAAFQGFYHDCPVLRDGIDPAIRNARLWLVEAVRIGLAIGLDLLGVSAPTHMERLDDTVAEAEAEAAKADANANANANANAAVEG